ncbi:MAG: hypothetical protein RLZZ631_2049 [Cyanobacteriota bacterium]|jgi:hypothetical protein
MEATNETRAADWFEALHRRAVDRVPNVSVRRELLGCDLVPIDAAGWPSFELRHGAGLPLPPATLASYRQALAKVLGNGAEALQQADQTVPTSVMPSLWQAALTRLNLPSTRMLLSQQSRIRELSSDGAVIEVAAQWLPMVQSRRDLVEEALQQAVGWPVAVTLVPIEDGEQNRQLEVLP